MEKSIVKRWVKALRSGKYKQAESTLRDLSNRMCCLGVLCDVTKKETGGDWLTRGRFGKSRCIADGSLLPPFVQKILNISSEGKLKEHHIGGYGSKHYTLSGLNDSGLSFKQIANIIEKNF